MKSIRDRYLVLMFLGTVTLCPSLSPASENAASAPVEKRHYWANIGFGFASVPGGLGYDDGGLSFGASLSYRKGGNLFSLRWVINQEFQLNLWGNSGPPENVWDIGVLYGRLAKAEHVLASISAGAGIVGASRNGNRLPYHVGIPIECQLFWTPTSKFGLGLYGFVDINSYKSFSGVLFCFQLCREM